MCNMQWKYISIISEVYLVMCLTFPLILFAYKNLNLARLMVICQKQAIPVACTAHQI